MGDDLNFSNKLDTYLSIIEFIVSKCNLMGFCSFTMCMLSAEFLFYLKLIYLLLTLLIFRQYLISPLRCIVQLEGDFNLGFIVLGFMITPHPVYLFWLYDPKSYEIVWKILFACVIFLGRGSITFIRFSKGFLTVEDQGFFL